MDVVSSKLEKNVFKVFTWFQNNYLKANSRKSHLLTTSDIVLHINVRGNQLSSSKHEKLLGVVIGYKLKFEGHLLNIVQKINQKIHTFEIISKYVPQKKLRITMKAFVTLQNAHCPLIWMLYNGRINHKINKLHERAFRIVSKDHFSSFKENLSQSIKEIFKYLLLRYVKY